METTTNNSFKLYQERLDALKKRKLEQIEEKLAVEGYLDEDDYGRVVPPKGAWTPIPNHADGNFYGMDGWCENFVSLMKSHPVYVDPNDAFAGRWMYFMSRMTNKWNPDYSYNHLQENMDKYNIICGIGDDAHFAPDYRLGLSLGWDGLLKKIGHYEKVYEQDPETKEFYRYHKMAIESIQVWIQRHIEHIERLIQDEKDWERKQNLQEMLEANRNIVSGVPSTLREACQWIIWYHLASRTYNRDGAGGQIDSMLKPYYENDLKNGVIDKDKAIYLLACFLINDPVYWSLGGPDEDGDDQTSEISFLILEAADKINTSLNITIRVHPGLNKELMRKSLRYLIKNKNAWPRYSGDKALVDGFMQNGFDEKLARKRIAAGCNWTSLPGLEYTMNDLVKVNMAKVFEVALQDMKSNCEPSEYASRKLFEIYQKHLAIAIHTAGEGVRFHLRYQKYNEPELLLNLLSHGPIEKGKDVSDGGATYYNLAIDGAGLAVVADSFAAIEQRVENEKILDWNKLFETIETDFEGTEGQRIKALLKNSPRFGQGNTIADIWAKNIAVSFAELVRKESDETLKYTFIPGFFSWANTLEFGHAVGSTPNGRVKGEPISHGANPCPGFSNDSTSLLQARAIASVQPGYGNTAPMQWEVDLSFVKEKQEEFLEAIIQTHFTMGGTLINVNVVNRERIYEAHKNPMLYPDLVVRVTGFTAYFSMLTPEFRQLVLDRLCEN
jgi:formate C-acetyltransferase